MHHAGSAVPTRSRRYPGHMRPDSLQVLVEHVLCVPGCRLTSQISFKTTLALRSPYPVDFWVRLVQWRQQMLDELDPIGGWETLWLVLDRFLARVHAKDYHTAWRLSRRIHKHARSAAMGLCAPARGSAHPT